MKSTGTTDIWGKDDDSNINSDAINQALELSLNKDSEQFTRLSIAEAIHKLWKLDSGIKSVLTGQMNSNWKVVLIIISIMSSTLLIQIIYLLIWIF